MGCELRPQETVLEHLGKASTTLGHSSALLIITKRARSPGCDQANKSIRKSWQLFGMPKPRENHKPQLVRAWVFLSQRWAATGTTQKTKLPQLCIIEMT